MSTPTTESSTLQHSLSICQKSSLLRTHQRVQALNDAAPTQIVVQVVNGEERNVERKPKLLPGSVEATMERLIKNYVRMHHGLLKSIGAPAFEQGMPALRTCRTELAGQRSISPKTAYNHVRKLRDLGFITNYNYRGSKNAFEIWIDPALLFQPERLKTPQMPLVAGSPLAASEPIPSALVANQSANFTAYKAIVTQGNLETEKIERTECGQGNAQRPEQGTNQGNTEQPAPKSGDPQVTMWQGERQTPVEKPSAGAGESEKRTIPGAGSRLKARLSKSALDAQAEAERTPQQQEAIQHGYVRSLWRYAQDKLYAGRSFTENENRLALRAIWAGVYNCFDSSLTEKEWDTYQHELYHRVDLAAGYYARHPTKWIPAPFAQFKPGAGYFDWANERGFRQTEAWLAENRRKLAKSRAAQAVTLAIRHLRLHRLEKAPKALQHKTYIDAYRTLEAKMQKLGPAALDRFRQLAATLDQQKPELTPGFTKNFRK